MRRATVIINPIAGASRATSVGARRDLATSTLAAYGYHADVRVTGGPADAQRFAADAVAAGADLVVAWGGDGTVNGAGAAVAGSSTALGIVAGGSGNGLARDLALPMDPAAALTVAATGTARAIDGGDLNGSLFFNVAGIGLDAAIAERMARPDARRGLLGYVSATVREVRSYRPRAYTIALRGGPAEGSPVIRTPALFIALANSRQYGNGAQIAPLAKVDDGLLDVVVVTPLPLGALAWRLPKFFRGTLREDARVLMRRAVAAEIAADEAIGFHVDGEPRQAGRTVGLAVRPSILRVMCK